MRKAIQLLQPKHWLNDLKMLALMKKDIIVTGPQMLNQNIVVRIHGLGKKPAILFLAHLDVVEARREDWSMDPLN